MSSIPDGDTTVQQPADPVQQPPAQPQPVDPPVIITLPNVPIQQPSEEVKAGGKPVKPKAPRKPAIKKPDQSGQQQPGEPPEKPRVQIVEELKQPEQLEEDLGAEEQIDTSSRREPVPTSIAASSKPIKKSEERLREMFVPSEPFAPQLFQRNQTGQSSWQRIRDRLNKGGWSKQRFR